jgi:hypothetical protein
VRRTAGNAFDLGFLRTSVFFVSGAFYTFCRLDNKGQASEEGGQTDKLTPANASSVPVEPTSFASQILSDRVL